MQNYTEYRKSISDELVAIKDRVRNIIGDRHWGEEGRYKEVILADILRKNLPQTVSVGTGFIMGEDRLSKQIDIIIYRSEFPVFFQQADFVIVPPEAVLGIIEVKSSAEATSKIARAIHTMAENAEMISDEAFSGIFAYEPRREIGSKIRNTLAECQGKVKYLCFGPKLFLMHWYKPLDNQHQPVSHYRAYEMDDLAFGYFISNLVEDVHIATTGQPMPNSLKRMLYPIEPPKEAHRLHGQDIICFDDDSDYSF